MSVHSLGQEKSAFVSQISTSQERGNNFSGLVLLEIEVLHSDIQYSFVRFRKALNSLDFLVLFVVVHLVVSVNGAGKHPT